MADPLAFFLTWTTYGTWLPGDQRGWVLRGRGFQMRNPIIECRSKSRLRESVCILDSAQRQTVEETIAEHCELRGWQLYAVNCRTNHVHVVVGADRHPNEVRNQLKAWCTRRLNEQASRGKTLRKNWWTERGSQRYICDHESLSTVIRYVNEAQ